jgi:membrane protein
VAALTYSIAQVLGSTAAAILAGAAPTLLLLAGLVSFFRLAVRRPRSMRRRVFPGAVTTLVLWTITTGVFSFYIAKIARYATFYGSLATVAILLFWLWLLAVALLVGGEVNAQLEGVRDPTWITSRPNDRRR